MLEAAPKLTVRDGLLIATASPLTFAPGDVQKTIQVNVVDDTAVEGTETVILNLGAASNATVANMAAILTLRLRPIGSPWFRSD